MEGHRVPVKWQSTVLQFSTILLQSSLKAYNHLKAVLKARIKFDNYRLEEHFIKIILNFVLFLETRSLHMALTALELALQTRLVFHSKICLTLSPKGQD